MARFGEYEIEATVAWGRRATFFAARTIGGKGESAVVVRVARSSEREFSQAFLRSAAEQQNAVVAGCKRFAPVLSFEVDASGLAWFATSRFETSLADFLEAGCQVDSQSLREIVTGVLGALSELQQLARRSHGNLTPGNVLLDENGRVFLTDLAPSAKDATIGDDLFALGRLIYQLVRRTARVGVLNPPIEYSPVWTESLGDDAEAWREFTNRLLFKAQSATPDSIKGALADLKSFRSLEASAAAAPPPTTEGEHREAGPRRPPRKRRLGLKIAAAFLILAAAGGGGWYWKVEKEKAALAEEKARREREDREFQDKLGRRLNDLREAIERSSEPEMKDSKDAQELFARIQADLNLRQSGASISAEEMKSKIQQRLDEWPVSGKLARIADAWRKPPREWKRFADEIESASKISVEDPNEQAPPIYNRLRDAVRQLNQAEEIEQRWLDIGASLAALQKERAQNPLLPDFEQWATVNELGRVTQLRDVPARSNAVADELGKVRRFCKDEWPRVHAERFKEKNPAVPPPVLDNWPANWMQLARQHFRPADEDVARWNKVIERAERRIAKLKDDDQRLWQGKVAKTKEAIANALEPDVADIDAKFIADLNNNLRYPIEKDHDTYSAFFPAWRAAAASALTKADATEAIAKLTVRFDSLGTDYRQHAGSAALIRKLTDALETPDAIKLNFSKPIWTEGAKPSAGVAIYKIGDMEIPFIALGTSGVAMAAVETPLSLARISGSGATPPRAAGPPMRTIDFGPVIDWLWSAPRDFIRTNNIASYFAPGVVPGDIGKSSVPVTWLTHAEARSMAEALGGRLPTAAEWVSALGKAGPVQRLRGGAWTAQYRQVSGWPANPGKVGSFPDIGSFSRTGGIAPNPYDATATGGSRDAALWMRSVFPSGGEQWQAGDNPAVFHHLIGNAAEWVTGPNGPAILGGSIVSPPKLPTRQPVNASTATVGFDLGFRLAVPIAEMGEGAGLKKFVQLVGELQPPPPPPIPE